MRAQTPNTNNGWQKFHNFSHSLLLFKLRAPLPLRRTERNAVNCSAGQTLKMYGSRVTMRDLRCISRKHWFTCVYSFCPVTQKNWRTSFKFPLPRQEEGLAKSTFLPSSFCRLSELYNSRQPLQRLGVFGIAFF